MRSLPLAVLVAVTGSVAAQEPPPRPNIVLIVADDLGWTDLSCTGSRYYETPNLDRLREEGMLFTSAYSNGPNCSPTRAALMSGKYPPRTGVTTVLNKPAYKKFKLLEPPKKRELAGEEVTLAETLHQAGYKTGHFGKWHLGDGELGPLGQGFIRNVGGDHRGHPASYRYPFENQRFSTPVEGKAGDYLTDVLTDQAIDFMMRAKKRSFFLYLPFFQVHTPIQGKPELVERFAAKTPVGKHRNPKYAAMIASMDENVGRIVRTIDALGMRETTLIVFVSDNGGHSVTGMAPLRGRKGMLYEGGIRVPMIARWPGRIAPGATCAEPVISLDLYPTVVELVGVQVQQELDGTSLVPLLFANGKFARSAPSQALYWHFPHYLPGRQTPAGAIRKGKWKLIETFETGALELFDLDADIGEADNKAEAEPEIAAALHGDLRAWRERVSAGMPKANPAWKPDADKDK